ncbi:fibrobacter succinogenes major paralogous domain-containing protein [Labilibaculum sp.]|uniref:fibrobacter succinogenes major paralogous domain-containing protein n=1 Tax=Labilibaculum sp. TaxID=2060723 RepID=UPI002AA637E9|nr:fibrobacter succinogenes major paralogous domain-containing protein [Labilibaculum sp.]
MNPELSIWNKYRSKAGLVALVIVCLSVFLNSCFENPSPPELTTQQIELVDAVTITSGGNITDNGDAEIFQKGICMSLNNTPTMQDFFTMDGVGNSDFTTILNLDPDNTYYIRAYAINGAGIGYGNVLSITLEPLPFTEAVIMDFGDITGNQAFMRGRIESNQTITSRGACWSTSQNPTISDSKTDAGNGTGIFETTITGLAPGTRYYARAYAATDIEVFYSSNYEFITLGYPQLTTKEIINAGTFVISTGGDMISQGLILNAGVCWSTNPSPTIADSKTEDQLVYTSFTSDPYGLLPATTYYIRSYATNIAGTGYGNELVITMPDAAVYDLDGNPYSSVSIGSQIWLTENLRTTKYANGENIPNIINDDDWQNATSGAWSYHENIPDYEVPYGKLYNWFAVIDSRNVCPSGWHVPSDTEWQTLITFLGGSDFAGNKLKETGTAHWQANNDFATNSSGFTALPGGAQSASPGYSYPIQSLGMFWSTAPVDGENAYGYYLFDSYQSINKQEYIKQTGLSVRCVKD